MSMSQCTFFEELRLKVNRAAKKARESAAELEKLAAEIEGLALTAGFVPETERREVKEEIDTHGLTAEEVSKMSFLQNRVLHIHPKMSRKINWENLFAVIAKLKKNWKFDEQILPALEWAARDDFWSKNLQSLTSLQNKGSNGKSKFENIYAAFTRNNNRHEAEPLTELAALLFENMPDPQKRQWKNEQLNAAAKFIDKKVDRANYGRYATKDQMGEFDPVKSLLDDKKGAVYGSRLMIKFMEYICNLSVAGDYMYPGSFQNESRVWQGFERELNDTAGGKVFRD